MSSRLLIAVLMLPVLGGTLSGCGEKRTTPPVAVAPAPAKAIQDGSLMVPGRPQLARLPDSVPVSAVQKVTWNMWWGENGRKWTVYVNGREAESGSLSVRSPQAQQVSVDLALGETGPVEIKVALCNDHGCSESEPAIVTVVAGAETQPT